jgi:hypothetical protein
MDCVDTYLRPIRHAHVVRYDKNLFQSLPMRSTSDTIILIQRKPHVPLAQWLEHWSYEPRVMGSNPIGDICTDFVWRAETHGLRSDKSLADAKKNDPA